MTRQANILSFDEVKAHEASAARSSRASRNVSKSQSRHSSHDSLHGASSGSARRAQRAQEGTHDDLAARKVAARIQDNQRNARASRSAQSYGTPFHDVHSRGLQPRNAEPRGTRAYGTQSRDEQFRGTQSRGEQPRGTQTRGMQSRHAARAASTSSSYDFSAGEAFQSAPSRKDARVFSARNQQEDARMFSAQGSRSTQKNAPAFSARSTRANAQEFFARNTQEDPQGSRTQETAREAARNKAREKAQRERNKSFAQTLRKRFRSAKADKAFEKTIGAQERASSRDEASRGSRAAMYEMRMGSTHRKSARMQDTNQRSGHARFSLASLVALPQATMRVLAVLVVAVFAVALLYPSCASYYQEVRQLQQLQAEYEAIESYNAQMQASIDYLNTDEGVEDYARSELGWIRSGEKMATVEGVEVTSSDNSDDILYSVTEDSVSAPDTWYSGVLDVLFGYRG